MNRARLWIGCSAFLLACACGDSDDTTSGASEDLTQQKRPIGTFRRELEGDEAGITLLVLKTDKTMHYVEKLVTCDPGECFVAHSGTYTYTGRRDSKGELHQYVHLHIEDGTLWNSLEYRYTGTKTLRIAYAGLSDVGWDALTRTDGKAWCEAPTDCAKQRLPAPSGCSEPTYACGAATSTCKVTCEDSAD